MDDQNNPNQPLDQSGLVNPPVVPNQLEDITPPSETPSIAVTPQEETVSPTEQPVMPEPKPVTPTTEEPVFVPPVYEPASAEPVLAMLTEPVISTEPTSNIPDEFSSPAEPTPNSPIDPPMPEGKSKSKLMPIIGGVVALLLVVGVAGAAYYVSNQMSTRQAVAPNAPESIPLAGEICDSTSTTHPACRGASVGDEVCYLNTANLKCTRTTGTLCSAVNGGSACGGGGGGGSCSADGTRNNCSYVNNIGSTGDKGSPCDSSNWSNKSCSTYTFKCGTQCFLASCGASACKTNDEVADKYQEANEITFNKTGTAKVYFGGGYQFKAVFTKISGTGTASFSVPSSGYVNGNAAYEIGSVTAGAKYSMKMTLKQDIDIGRGDSLGWRKPKSVQTAHISCDATAAVNASKGLFDLKTEPTDVNYPVMCWADSIVAGGPAQSEVEKYDFDDFVVTVGYTTTAAAQEWNITTTLVCPSGFTPKSIQMARIVWPRKDQGPNDFDCVNDIASKATTHTMKISSNNPMTDTSGNPSQGYYVYLQTGDPSSNDTTCKVDGTVVAPATLSVVPSVPIGYTGNNPATGDFFHFAKYFNPPTQMLYWQYGRLAQGSYNITYNLPTTLCESTEVGACMMVKIYKKVGGVYGTTPLTTAQLQKLTVGDVLKFSLDANKDNLNGRFRVTMVASPKTATWLEGTIDSVNPKLINYEGYTIAAAGNYTFEAQVTTMP